MNTLRLEICLFILTYYPIARTWEKAFLLKWVDWYRKQGLLGVVREMGRIKALGFARCLRDLKQWEEPYTHFEDGEILWVELQICQDRIARQALWHCVLKRLGGRKWVAHGRAHRGQHRVWCLPFNQIMARSS